MKRAWKITIVLLVSGLAGSNASLAGEMLVGVAEGDITPPLGYRMSGYFNERLNTATHDPLKAKAIVFKQGDVQAAMVFCDLVGMSSEVTRKARALASQQTGIPHANMVIAATHSHTGPLYFDVLRDYFHELALKKHGQDPQEKIDYPATLVQTLAATIARAQANLQPVRIDVAVAQERRLSFNRRFHMKDGSVVFNPGKLNPNIVRAAGPIDPEVGMVRVLPASQENPLATLTVFALHLDTVGGTEFSADYPYYLEQSLKQALGPNLVSLFGNGTCGDINHVDVSHDRAQKGQEEAQRIGTALAETVKGAWPKLRPLEAPSLAVRSVLVQAPLQQYNAEQVARAKENLTKVGTSALPFLDQVEACKIVAIDRISARTLPLEVQVFRLSKDVAIVGLPGEVFVDLGLAIKKHSPFSTTLVIELCNDTPDYIPTRKAFTEGSYETVNSLVQSGGGEMLVEAAGRLLGELKENAN